MIVVERAVGPAFVQDGGRSGRMHDGVPPGGALVAGDLARANLAVGNQAGAAGIERFGAMTLAARGEDHVLAEDDGVPRTLRDGERIDLAWDGARRARCVAIRGGIDVPVVLGGRGTLISAGLGGLEGRALRRGDALAIGRAHGTPRTLEDASERAIRVLAGPDLEAYAPRAIEELVARAWRISVRSDRTGTRLEGASIAWSPDAPAARTTPMIAGAIELPPGGEPIVLGPDHPTTGGYPVVAVIASASLDRFHAIPPGREVRLERG